MNRDFTVSMEKGVNSVKRFVLKAPDGRYFQRFSFAEGMIMVLERRQATDFEEPYSGWCNSLIACGMLTKEYLPEVRYGVMVRYLDTYPGEVRVKYLCHQPRWPKEGYVLIQHPSRDFPIVTWATVEEIPFKVSKVGFCGHDRLVAVEVVDGVPVA